MTLALDSITVEAGGRRLVDDLTAAIAPGRLTVLLGPNGAGKTTLIRAVCGVIGHTGRATWNGTELGPNDRKARARTVAYVPQGHLAHWPVSARMVVALGRSPHVSSLSRLRPEDEAIIDRALAAVDATAFADRAVTTLSGGERARVMLARALAVETPVLMLDEPIAALDPAHQIAIAELLVGIAREGRAVLAVMHDLMLASRYADTVLVMSEGRLVAEGPPADVLSDERLRDVFGVAVARAAVGTGEVIIPWTVRHPSGQQPNRA